MDGKGDIFLAVPVLVVHGSSYCCIDIWIWVQVLEPNISSELSYFEIQQLNDWDKSLINSIQITFILNKVKTWEVT